MKKLSLSFLFCISCLALSFAQNNVEVLTLFVNTSNCYNTVSNNNMNQSVCTPNLTNINLWERNSRVINDRQENLKVDDRLKKIECANKKDIVSVSSNATSTMNRSKSAYELLVANASQAFIDKNYTKCIDICDVILQANRNNSEAYFLKGTSNYALGNTDIAITFFKIAAAKGSKDARETLKMFEK